MDGDPQPASSAPRIKLSASIFDDPCLFGLPSNTMIFIFHRSFPYPWLSLALFWHKTAEIANTLVSRLFMPRKHQKFAFTAGNSQRNVLSPCRDQSIKMYQMAACRIKRQPEKPLSFPAACYFCSSRVIIHGFL